MAKASKKDRIKLPKRLLGVKLPKATRKSLNRMLKSVSTDIARPLAAAAVGAFATIITERLEAPLKDLAERSSPPKRPTKPEAVKH
jgi:hypothetical protein